MNAKKYFRALVASFVLAVGSNSAQAVCDGCVVGAVGVVGTALNTWAAVIWQTLEKTVTSIKVASLSITSVAKEMGAKQIAFANKIQTDSEQLEARYQFTVPDPCSIAASSGTSDAYRDSAAAGRMVGRGGTTPALPTGTVAMSGGKATSSGAKTQMTQLVNSANGRSDAPSPEITAAAAASAGCGLYAGSGSYRAVACANAGFNAGSGGYTRADISATTLFDGPQKDGEPVRKKYTLKPTPNQDSAEELAMQAFLRNMGVPIELRTLQAAELSSVGGRRYMAVKDVFDARISFAQRPSARHIAMMTPSTSTIQALKEMVVGNSAVSTYLGKYVPDWQTKGVSADELINIDIERRYGNLEWLAKTASQDPRWVQGEQLRVSAQQNVLLWRLNQEIRENSILVGGLAASQFRTELLPELKAAHAAATR